MTIRNLCLAGAAALAVGMAADDARALGVGPTDPGFIATFNEQDNLLATLTFSLQNKVGNVWTFAIEVANQSIIEGDLTKRITSFGFGLDPTATAVNLKDNDDGLWNGAVIGTVRGNNPNPGLFGAGYQHFAIDTCVFDGPTCEGGGDGVKGGQTSNLVLEITSDAESLFFTDVATRWQSIDLGPDPDKPGKNITSIVIGGDIAPIPLPPVGFMLLGALGALAFAARRRPVEKAAA